MKILTDKNISWKAKGIFIFLATDPEIDNLCTEDFVNCSSDGKHSFRSGINELIKNGYIKRKQIRAEKGRMSKNTWEILSE